MGTTYQFTKLPKDRLFSGELSKMMPKQNCLCFDDDDPLYEMISYTNAIGQEMDREDFIGRIMGCRERPFDSVDPRYAEEPARTIVEEYQLRPLDRAMVQKGYDTLVALDEKVFSMPFDRSRDEGESWYRGGIMLKSAYENGDCKKRYAEPCDIENLKDDHVYYGRDANDVAIVREVAKVYGRREYHYGYPWRDRCNDGAKDLRLNFEAMLREMDDDKEGKYVYFCHWS